MGLLDDLAVVDGRDYGSDAVERMLAHMDDDLRAGAVAALLGPMGHAELARKLNKHGYLTDVKGPADRIAAWRKNRKNRVDAS